MRVPRNAGRPALFSPRLIPAFVVLALAALVWGVHGAESAGYAVAVVLVKGKPAAHAQVTFHPVNDNSPEAVHPVGTVDEKGGFTLTSYQQGDGAPEGEYLVTVQWFLATKPRNASAGDDYTTVNHLPARYGRPESSGLRATVRKGDNELPPFSLEPR